jgi:hypothetical protein
LLSRFGQLHRELLKDLKARFETLAAAVQAAGPERLRIVGARRGEEWWHRPSAPRASAGR